MDQELELWKKAGKLAGESLEFGKKLIKEDVSLLEVSNKIEEFIFKNNGKIGFPVQISINNIAAHYTSPPDDISKFKSGDVVKLDIGTHIDGYIGDTALTVEIGSNNHEDLIKASKEALNEAIKLCKPGTKVCEIGEAVNSAISSFGFKPIKNLSGHRLERYTLHGNISIPNYNNKDQTKLEEGMVIAIEPFASTGIGLVREGKISGTYRLVNSKSVRDPITREILGFIQKEYTSLPFAKRYLTQKFTAAKASFALMNLEKLGIIYQYPQLPEKQENCHVSQHEHTIYISDKPIILTKWV